MYRKCVGCGELKPKENLIKITKDYVNGNIVFAPNSKTFGRSAYLCYNQSCIKAALKKNRINKALKTNAKFEESMFKRFFDDKKELKGQ